MYVVVVDFVVVPARAEDFRSLVLANAKSSLATEVGCRRFDVAIAPSEPTKVLLYELYDDAAAFALHLASSHFVEFNQATKDWVEHKVVRTFDLVEA